ncbi:MAG: DUF1588 domain-containing protein [Akkermansiaceae bacterium]
MIDRATLQPFLETHCVRCHGEKKQKGKLRFDQLDFSISDQDEALHYQDILDVLNTGEMPPEEEEQPAKAELEGVIRQLTDGLFDARKRLASSGGKVEMRRLNRREYGATIRHLFGFEPPASRIPPDQGVENFDTVGSRQQFTTEHLDQYYELAREIVLTAFKWSGVREESQTIRQQPEDFWNNNFRRSLKAWEGQTHGKVVRLSKMRHEYLALPNVETGVYLAEPLRHLTYRRKIDPRGTYRIRVNAGLSGKVHPMRRFVRVGAGDQETAGVFYITGTTENPSESVVEITPATLDGQISGYVSEDRTGAWLSHYLKSLKRYRGIETKDEGLIWIESIAVEGPSYPEKRSFFEILLFPERPVPGMKSSLKWTDDNARELIERFTVKAFRRRAVDQAYLDHLHSYFQKQRTKNLSFEEAMARTLAVVMVSPGFLYLNEVTGVQEDVQMVSSDDLANRLSFFLTSGPPEDRLYEEVERGASESFERYHAGIDRVLKLNNLRFAEGFGSQWADFDRLDAVSVSKNYPTYTGGLLYSAKQEVISTFEVMVAENLPVSTLIKSDFVMINAKLADHYGISNVVTNEFVKVTLEKDSPRGGYLGQAAFLVAGSNGERTSPTVRGMILLNRFLNDMPPPPPPNVPELGADQKDPLTTRKLVELHQSRVQCASCHRKMDAIGLALENFDLLGRWRVDEVTAPGVREPIVVGGSLPEGRAFKSFQEFQETLMSYEEKLARNMLESLLVYGLGRDVEFTDKPHLDAMMDQLRPKGFRMRDMIHAVAASPLFFRN